MEGLIYFAIAVYFLFHLVSKSDLLARPREWLVKTLGPTLSYPLSCVFCWSWWLTLITAVFANPGFPLPIVTVTFVPVFNLVLDSLITKLKADVEKSSVTINDSDRFAPIVQTYTFATEPSSPWYPKPLGEGWFWTNRDESEYGTSGVWKWSKFPTKWQIREGVTQPPESGWKS